MDISEHNRVSWNQSVDEGERWTVPVDAEAIARARGGDFPILLTPNRPVPGDWFPESIQGLRILCLASGGGQQAPLLAAAGAHVTSMDYSDKQLGQDRVVADREGLDLETVHADMTERFPFEDQRFDVIIHACSNCFIADIKPVWKECFRVLSPGGSLMSGFLNPTFYLFNHEEAEETGEIVIRHRLPYTDLDLPEKQLKERMAEGETIEFSHSLDDQIGGQIEAGFVITGFFEDDWDDKATILNRHMPTLMATRAEKAK